jgi:8-oxo-dGTP pyrophosphatase MutT (NUDIX family)
MNDLIRRVDAALGRPMAASSDYDLNPEITLPSDRVLRPAGVLVGIFENAGTPVVYLTKRASHLKHHPGQIAFPGGKVDPSDTDEIAAAIREANEEIALPSEHLRIMGTLSPHETVTGFNVVPVVAEITRPFTPKTDPTEVEEAFCVPLSHVLDPQNYLIESRIWRGNRRKFFTVPYGPYYIWGATARMLYGLATRVSG